MGSESLFCDRYDQDGKVIVTSDDRFHGDASPMREMVESLSAWEDLDLWQYRLDLLREALDHEQETVDRERRNALTPQICSCGHSVLVHSTKKNGGCVALVGSRQGEECECDGFEGDSKLDRSYRRNPNGSVSGWPARDDDL